MWKVEHVNYELAYLIKKTSKESDKGMAWFFVCFFLAAYSKM